MSRNTHQSITVLLYSFLRDSIREPFLVVYIHQWKAHVCLRCMFIVAPLHYGIWLVVFKPQQCCLRPASDTTHVSLSTYLPKVYNGQLFYHSWRSSPSYICHPPKWPELAYLQPIMLAKMRRNKTHLCSQWAEGKTSAQKLDSYCEWHNRNAHQISFLAWGESPFAIVQLKHVSSFHNENKSHVIVYLCYDESRWQDVSRVP